MPPQHRSRSAFPRGRGGKASHMNPWIASIISAVMASGTVVAVFGYVLAVPYKSAVENAVRTKFEKDLEAVRSDFRRDEERLRADIRRGEDELNALRSGALANLTTRQAELGRRRLQALEAVWSSVVDMGRLKWGVRIAQALKFDALLDATKGSGSQALKLREFIGTIAGPSGDLRTLTDLVGADKERPFVPPLVWAVYAAYRTIMYWPPIMFAAIKAGAGTDVISPPDEMMKMLKEVLPHQSDYIDQWRESSFALLVDELELKLLTLIKDAVEKPGDDRDQIEQAENILKAVEALKIAEAKTQAAAATA